MRVTPVRRSVLTTPGPIDVTVKLEHLTSGRVVELRDSIVRFEGGGVDEAEDLFTHNFWTTEPIEPGATYAVTVMGADGGPGLRAGLLAQALTTSLLSTGPWCGSHRRLQFPTR